MQNKIMMYINRDNNRVNRLEVNVKPGGEVIIIKEKWSDDWSVRYSRREYSISTDDVIEIK